MTRDESRDVRVEFNTEYDESGAALDPVNSRHYVAMLRRAADLVGADRVLVVSHSPEVHELCDERIEVAHV